MSKFDVSIEDSFEFGIREGRKQVLKHILECINICEDLETIKKHLHFLQKYDLMDKKPEIKGFISKVREAQRGEFDEGTN